MARSEEKLPADVAAHLALRGPDLGGALFTLGSPADATVDLGLHVATVDVTVNVCRC